VLTNPGYKNEINARFVNQPLVHLWSRALRSQLACIIPSAGIFSGGNADRVGDLWGRVSVACVVNDETREAAGRQCRSNWHRDAGFGGLYSDSVALPRVRSAGDQCLVAARLDRIGPHQIFCHAHQKAAGLCRASSCDLRQGISMLVAQLWISSRRVT